MNDSAAVAAELEGLSLTNIQPWTAPHSQTPNNLHLGPELVRQNRSQRAEASFDIGAASAARLLCNPDLDPRSPDSSPQETFGLTLCTAVSPTPSCQLS